MSSSIGLGKMLGRGLLTRSLFPRSHFRREESSLWNPNYLEKAKSKFPEFATTNIQIKGYDYAILESYQSKIHWVSRKLGLHVTDCWSQEYQKLKVLRFKTKTDTPESEYIMKRYERNVQVSDVYSYQMGTLIDLVISMCPAGVTVRFQPHEQIYYENRFVPEPKIMELKQQLQELDEQK